MALVGTSLIDAPSFIGGGSGLAFSSTISGLGSETGAIANGDTLLAALAKVNGRLIGYVDGNNEFLFRTAQGWQVKSDNPYTDLGPYHPSSGYNTGLKFQSYDVGFFSNASKCGGYGVNGFYIGDSRVFLLATNNHILEQRNGANAQELRIYGDYTDASNYARLAFRTAAGDYTIAAEAAGGGTLRNLVFNGANRVAKINDVAGTPTGSNATIISDLQAAVAYLIDMGEAWGMASTS